MEVENTKGKQSQEVGVGEKGDGKRNQGGGRGGGDFFVNLCRRRFILLTVATHPGGRRPNCYLDFTTVLIPWRINLQTAGAAKITAAPHTTLTWFLRPQYAHLP